MRLIKENDLFELRALSLVSDEDLRVIHLLYQPFLGHLAVGIYQTLLYTRDLYVDGPSSHEFLFKQLGCTALEFANAIIRLEACELIRTYAEKTEEFSYYYYELFAPKLAKDFFKDPVFSGLLNSYVSERRVQQIAELFSSNKAYRFKDKEVTTSFGEVYNPDLNAEAFNRFIKGDYIGRNELGRKAPFDITKFKDYLRKNHMIIADHALNSDDINSIIALTMIYSFNEETMAQQIGAAYDASQPLGQRVDFDLISRSLKELTRYKHIARPKKIKPINKLDSDSDKAKLINRMEIEPSYDFLSSFNQGAVVSDSEMNLLLRLSQDYHLSNAVINALIYHILMNYNMQLPNKLVEKYASTLVRLKFDHAVDVVNYFAEQKQARKVGKTKKVSKPKVAIKANEEAEISDEAYEKLLKELKNV